MPPFLDIGENCLEYYKDVLEDNYTYQFPTDQNEKFKKFKSFSSKKLRKFKEFELTGEYHKSL